MTALIDRLAAAAGDPGARAAIHIIVHACRGELPTKLGALIDDDPEGGRAWLDWSKVVEASAPFSGGERRLIAIAASLHSGHPVNLADVLTGLDEANAHIVLDAIAHSLRIP